MRQKKLDLDFNRQSDKPLLFHGDCLEKMSELADNSIDLICCDLPYGITNCNWDTIIPFDKLWLHYNRIIKNGCAIVLFASQPFTSSLTMSNIKNFSYQWVWCKSRSTGFLNAYRMPMAKHEDILVFSSNGKLPTYYPILTNKLAKDIKKGSKKYTLTDNYGKMKFGVDTRKLPYNKSLPNSILNFDCARKTVHSTQKPVKLLEYLIRTYTEPGGVVLDNCMGSGTTGVAAQNTDRNFIGIELGKKYFEIAKQRIENG